jgi:hypothetical protein
MKYLFFRTMASGVVLFFGLGVIASGALRSSGTVDQMEIITLPLTDAPETAATGLLLMTLGAGGGWLRRRNRKRRQ